MSELQQNIALFAKTEYQKPLAELTAEECHYAVSKAVMADIADVWQASQREDAGKRRAYYLSAEFLVGRAIHNNLLCTGLDKEVAKLLQENGIDLSRMEEIEDAALGNGGLGRLAACFLDSAATLGLPLDGYGIRYRYGLFRQSFQNGFQSEAADDWTRYGDPWSIRRESESVTVSFGDGDVLAVPYDMPIIGYGKRHISTLRLWQCEPTEVFSFSLFNEQQYERSVRRKNRAEDISRVLYPNDDTPSGKLLRLKQQYFFSSASLQDILRRFESAHGDSWSLLPEFVTLQLNDTHPVIAIPELIRLLMERDLRFEEGLAIAKQVFCYTNHTVMQEALEKWDLRIVRRVSPVIARIIQRIHVAFQKELKKKDVDTDTYPHLSIIQDGTVHMAYLACYVCRYINGVAQIHTDILQSDVLAAWYRLYPDKFQNKTNGITQRRWLALCNPELSSFITELLGHDKWITDLSVLRSLAEHAQNGQVLERFIQIKQHNKNRLAAYMKRREGTAIDPERILDVQIKRMHEYKRQLLNILCILELYFEIKEGTLPDFVPTTFLFGGKAAPGYFRAKAVIKLIREVADLIAQDEQVSRYIQVVFVENYDVSYAEQIVAAADVSEQISTAGTEASGTGNMKLMLNGAVTLGTYDGANIEIVQEAGEDNNLIFGAKVEEIREIAKTYSAREYFDADPRIRRCLNALVDGLLDDGGTGMFRELYTALLDGASWHQPDHYYLLLDFASCLDAKKEINRQYADRYAFAGKQWQNVCHAGKFSSDRTIAEYAADIWHIQ